MTGFESTPTPEYLHDNQPAKGDASSSWNLLKDMRSGTSKAWDKVRSTKDEKQEQTQRKAALNITDGEYLNRLKAIEDKHQMLRENVGPLSPELQNKMTILELGQKNEAHKLYVSQKEDLKAVGCARRKEVDDINNVDKNRKFLKSALVTFRGEIHKEYSEAARIASGKREVMIEKYEKRWDKLAEEQDKELTEFRNSLSGEAARNLEEPVKSENPFDDSHAMHES